MSDDLKDIQIRRIKAALVSSIGHVKPLLKRLHPSDIARLLEDLSPESRRKIISLMPVEQASEAISEMGEEYHPEKILQDLRPEIAAGLIEELDPDDAADLLANLPKEDFRLIVSKLPIEDVKVIKTLLTYPEDTAGGIMNPEILKIAEDSTKREALEEIIRRSDEMEDIYFIHVVDRRNRIRGIVSFKDLLRARPNMKVKNIMDTDIVTVDVEEDQEEVARIMQRYNLPAVPVVDSNGFLLGRITFDDILDVLEEESTEDILKIAGVSEDEELRGSWADAVKSRLPWLIVNLLTASTAGFVISMFDDIIQQIVVITSYMPIIAGVAGNGATQSLAVTIRRISTGGVNPKEYFRIILKEIGVGLTNGILLGLVVSVVGIVLSRDPQQSLMLGLVIFLAMTGNLFIAGFAGSSVPLLLQRLGVDPAVASSILITAFTDILGYTLLLGLGTQILL